MVIANLAGKSRLFSTPSRDGGKRRVIDDRPGRIVLLSAPAFAGRAGEAAHLEGPNFANTYRAIPSPPSEWLSLIIK